MLTCAISVLSEFSESLGELGANLLKRTALNDDEDSGELATMFQSQFS